MKPHELLQPENMPEELQWVAEHYRLQPNDPVFLLIAWHWQTVQGGESKLKEISLELQAAMTARAKELNAAAESIAKVGAQLTQVQAALDSKPATFAKRLETELSAPITAAVTHLAAADQALKQAVKTVAQTQGRQTLVAFVIGVVFGGSVLAWALF